MSQPTFVSSVLSEFPNDPSVYLRDESQAFAIVDSLGDYHKRLFKEFLKFLGKGQGAYNLIKAIIDHPDLVEELAKYLKTNVLTPIRAAAGKTPSAQSTPLEEEQFYVESLIMTMEPSARNDQKKPKERTLIRDGGRCVLTGISDSTYDPRGLPTECARILPFSLGSFNDNSSTEVSNSAEIFGALHFVFPELRNFDSGNVNDDCNAFTLVRDLHKDFDELRIALLPTSDNHVYKLLQFNPKAGYFLLQVPEYVTLRCNSDSIDMPDAKLLRAHAVVTQVWNTSGMESQFTDVLALRSLSQLAPDGSTNIPDIARHCTIS